MLTASDEVEWLTDQRGCNNLAPTQISASVAKDKSGARCGLWLAFGSAIMKDMGWQPGCKLRVGALKSGGMAVASANGAGGYKLSKFGTIKVHKNALAWFPKEFLRAKCKLSFSVTTATNPRMICASIPSSEEVRRLEAKVLED